MSFAAKVTCTSEARAALDDSRERIGGRRAPQPTSDCSGPHSGRSAWAPAATAPRRGMIRAYLAKVRVEGSNPFSRSTPPGGLIWNRNGAGWVFGGVAVDPHGAPFVFEMSPQRGV